MPPPSPSSCGAVRGGDGSPWSIERLTRPQGFNGAGGLFRLRRNGANERALAVYRLAEEGPELLAPAPLRFARP